jgi:DNA-binding transcriptional MerR regulator
MAQATERKFVGIGYLADALGVSPSTVRKWEADGAIPAADRVGGSERRIYRLEDVEVLRERAQRRRDRLAPVPS